MKSRNLRVVPWIVAAVFLLSACGQGGSAVKPVEPEPTQMIVTETPLPASPTSTPTVTPSPTAEPTATPTQAPQISVIENTNCRTGPGESFPFQGVLSIGEAAEVLGRSTSLDYWLVTNEELPKVGCWLWGEFAEVEGNLDAVPVYTPMPSPTPQVGFDVYVKTFQDCDFARFVVFAVRNAGSERFWSGYVQVDNLDKRSTMFYARERHPFADTVYPLCLPDHGNKLMPGETKYIHVPLSATASDINAMGIITLCTGDFQGGTCLTKHSFFYLE